jgi:DNA-binding transcriptional LysR family regulator
VRDGTSAKPRSLFDLRDLACFMEIVERRSFGRAAEALGMTQPALSRRIAGLERAVGAALFSREHRQIEVTSAGEIFAREALAVLTQAASAERVLREASRRIPGRLKIGTRGSARYVVIPEAIRRFRAEYPDVSVILSDPQIGLQADHLRRGVFDLTVARVPGSLSGLRSEQLRDDPLMVALPREHRLAEAPVIDVGDLSEESFIEFAMHRGAGYRELVREVFASAGFVPTVVQEVDTVDTMALCVAAGLGIALMHDASRELPIPGIVYRPLRPETTIPLQAVWRAGDENPMIAPFVRYLKEAARSYDKPA